MSKIEQKKIYNSALITEGSDNKWTSFENFQGSQVELFLKDKLEDAVVELEYHNTNYITPDKNEILNNVLVGKNAFGRDVCYTRVINADPTYTANFAFQNLTIGANTYNAGTTYGTVQVNKSDTLTASTTFTYLLTGNIAGNEFNETSALSITFKWFKDQQGLEVDATLEMLTLTVIPGETIVVNITPMYNSSFSNRYLGVVFKTPKSDVEITKMFDIPFTLRKLDLSYNGELVINSNILTKLNLEGTAGEDLGTYKLQYYLDNQTKASEVQLSSNMTFDLIQLELPNLSEGAHDVFVRAVSGGNLTSNYIQIGFIYQKTSDSGLTSAIAMVSEVPNEIDNCNLSKFFKVITTANLSGDIEIVALKSPTPSLTMGISTIEAAKSSQYLFKEINLSLLSTDPTLKIDYTSYIEVPGNENTTECLKILVKDGLGVRTLNYFQLVNNSPSRAAYKNITITNPKEGSTHLQYTVGDLLKFSQISNGNFFTDLSEDLDSADGLQLENVMDGTNSLTLTTFKVSPNPGVFKIPKKLTSAGKTPLHKGAFSIEMMFKTYGISDLEDKIMTIGNLTLCPKHLFLNYKPEENTKPHHIVNASRADFRKETIQHMMITYDPAYKPSTYDIIYDKFFTSGDTTYTKNASSYPCLKIFVNGTINRIISVGSGTLSNTADFDLQIHPSNSNINYYIFRTYDKALTYELVKKNYISSMSKLTDKQNYYLDNDILYLSTDFSAGDVEKKRALLNTISLGKCINKFKSVSNPNQRYTDRRVILVALAEEVLPPFYGNRKDSEPKAAFLVHYPEVESDGTFVPSQYSGVLNGGKVKAQGSSAKKYMFHNTSYSKFLFVTESEARAAAAEKRDPAFVEYYKMPGSDIEIKKLVGKVNYASSMQSHKQGATKLFHEAYVSTAFGFDTSWMNGGRKAVLEDDFLYFFVNVPKDDLEKITWDYFKQEDGTYNFENCYFLGFQTWGSAKGDKPTSGYSEATPYYLMLEGADNDNSSANFKTPWASLQIWGNYNNGTWRDADSTFIQPPTQSPENNKNYYHQFAGGTQDPLTKLWTPDYLSGLLINDETLVFNPGLETETSSDKKADAWDVDFGCTEGDGYYEKGNWYLDGKEVDEGTAGAVKAEEDNLFWVFEDKAKESLKKFAQFYNLVYTYDFSSLLYIPHGTVIDGYSMEINGKTSYQYKLVFGADCTITYGSKEVKPIAGDIYRWEKAWPGEIMSNSEAKWVPAGLYHNGTNWESLNVADICTWYCRASLDTGTYPQELRFFADEKYKSLKAIGDNGASKYIFQDGYTFNGFESNELIPLQACMAEAFKIIMYEFLDVNDVSYHSAFIKLVAGTDNRAKNTYFQIVGPIFTDKAEVDEFGEVSLVKISSDDEHNKKPGFIQNGVFYTISIDDDDVVTTTGETIDAASIKKTKKYCYKQTDKGDFKIRLYADDLDTIFKTDNNGQQVKPYYLLEPPYNTDLEELWGDMHSGFFYNFDLTCTSEIKNQLGKLLDFAISNEWPDTPSTKMYLYFFSILKAIPSIAYNHQSEIYYESPQVFWQNGAATALYDIFANGPGKSSWKDFNNNKVQNPVSLSHGSCLEAEVEYLRDRSLLLSTYTNTAKNQTDENILLNGGSATTQGSEVTISANYTSFIQYIYPIINNIASSKNTTDLQYDPLLDYMSWNSELGRYNNIDLAYNIALPNKPLDLSVKFSTSGLTSNSFWTSTDLYRTIWITSGTNSFSQLFNFPNASTVISQDPNYKIEILEGKEIEVVDYLESIEHLVLQNAVINSSGLDFTGCNRLKTLVLGGTEDVLSDSPEGTPSEDMEYYAVKFKDVLDPQQNIRINGSNASIGFSQIILPKSNSVELVILPNCVKIVNVNHYPNLTRFEFNSGTQLTNLTIDGRNSNDIIEYILTNFVGTYTTNLEITNIPDNFWLTEATCEKLTQINNVKMVGNINIGDGVNLAEIDWTTRKALVEKFGNIDYDSNNHGELTFTYSRIPYSSSGVSVNATGTIQSSGTAPIQISIEGNHVPIDTASDAGSKRLKIYYSIKNKSGVTPNSSDIRFENKWTPRLIIKEGLKGEYVITTDVYITSTTKTSLTTTLIVGFYAPKVGDFAYANGSFSSVYDPNQGIVGVVFYSSKSTNDKGLNVYDVRVWSANYSSTDVPMAPASYATLLGADSSLAQQKAKQAAYNSLLTALGIDPLNYIVDVIPANDREGGVASGTIKYNSTINNVELHQVPLSNVSELNTLKLYINRAAGFLNSLKRYANISFNALEADGWAKPTKEGKDRFEQVLLELKGLPSIDVGTLSFSQSACGTYSYAMYPAFLKALYYEPNTQPALSDKGIVYFGIGNWYVPDSRELERMIYYRINSAIENGSLSEEAWNSTVSINKDVSGKKLNVFTPNTFSSIAFLKDTGAQISAVGNNEGESLAYGEVWWDGNNTPGWHLDSSSYDSSNICARDLNHNISPVCRIELIES